MSAQDVIRQHRLRHIRRAARALRYLPLPELIGYTLVISSLDQIVPAVQSWLDTRLPGCICKHENDWAFPGTLAKYDLLDMSFSGPRSLLPDARTGVAGLRELGFLGGDNAMADIEDPAEDLSCIADLADGLGDEAIVKVFLEGVDKYAAQDGLPGNRLAAPQFPKKMTVTDACVTNSDMVWLQKHFYL